MWFKYNNLMRILITGGNGNLATIVYNSLHCVHDIKNPNRNELNLLNANQVNSYLKNNHFDVLIHTAITGGRRTKEDDYSVFYNNLLMWENILVHANKFKLIINLDSAAIYDRSTDIFNRREDELHSIPIDYYGFSKYVIYKRSLEYKNICNFRIFNIFHSNEEPDRFIKKCILAKKTKSNITIFEDKYFDFVSEEDFITILNYYIMNHLRCVLPRTINVCYNDKYKLSTISKMVLGDDANVIINDSSCSKNYCGNNDELKKLNLNLNGLEKSILKMHDVLNLTNI